MIIMHELSIANDILTIIRQNVPQEELSNIGNVNIRIGEMSGVVAESLEFCFQAIISETELNNAKLIIEKVPFAVKCNSCGNESTNEFGIRVCSNCSSTDTTVISGLEMQVTEVELKTESEEVI
jgi:hydrogenase nickel incorporation protein HypA/HybF